MSCAVGETRGVVTVLKVFLFFPFRPHSSSRVSSPETLSKLLPILTVTTTWPWQLPARCTPGVAGTADGWATATLCTYSPLRELTCSPFVLLSLKQAERGLAWCRPAAVTGRWTGLPGCRPPGDAWVLCPRRRVTPAALVHSCVLCPAVSVFCTKLSGDEVQTGQRVPHSRRRRDEGAEQMARAGGKLWGRGSSRVERTCHVLADCPGRPLPLLVLALQRGGRRVRGPCPERQVSPSAADAFWIVSAGHFAHSQSGASRSEAFPPASPHGLCLPGRQTPTAPWSVNLAPSSPAYRARGGQPAAGG